MTDEAVAADDESRRWAQATLGVAADAPLETARAAFLKKVEREDFFPSTDHALAWQALTATGDALPPRVAQAIDALVGASLRAPVEAFAAQFFSIDVSERTRQWFALQVRCHGSPPLLARLESLSRGLHLDAQTSLPPLPAGDAAHAPSARLVAARILEMFVLRPIDRAKQQQEVLQSWQADLPAWRAAARDLARNYQPVAELNPEFMDLLLLEAKGQAARPPRGPLAKARSEYQGPKISVWKKALYGLISVVLVISFRTCLYEPIIEPRIKFPTQRHSRPPADVMQQLEAEGLPVELPPRPPKPGDLSAFLGPATPSDASSIRSR